jgi:glycosyltransferase involved in cell wall biosynthesis
VRLVLVGDGSERLPLEALARELDVADAVQFLGTRSDVPRLLAAADVFLLTSVSEGIPLTLIEAMAAGVPVVATDVGGVGEMVDDGVTGCLAIAGDDATLARHVRRLTDDREFRAGVVERARCRARERFSLDRMLADYARTYEEMLRG